MSWTGGWIEADPSAQVPASTTWPDIRALMYELMRALVPTVLPSMRFRTWETNELDFYAWADAAAEPFRTFTIERIHDDREPRFLSPVLSQVAHGALLLISYPRQVDLFNRRLEDIIDQDVQDVTRVLGLRARADYATISAGLLSVQRESATREDSDAAAVAIIQFRLEYDRTIP